MAKRKKHRKNKNRRNTTGNPKPKQQLSCVHDECRKNIAKLNETIKANPEDTAAYIARGIEYLHMGQNYMAIEDCTMAINLDTEIAIVQSSIAM